MFRELFRGGEPGTSSFSEHLGSERKVTNFMPRYYPIFMDLQNREVLVVGGGAVAQRKVKSLLDHGALVRIVSPEIKEELRTLIDGKQCRWEQKEYAPDDVGNAFLVFSCTERKETNRQVAEEAHSCCRPVNVVDDPAQGSFIVPSTMERGDLKIAVSTSGASPLVARQIRCELERFYGKEMECYLELLGKWRPVATLSLPKERRGQFWQRVTDGEVLALIKNQQVTAAEGVIEDCFRSLLD